MVGPGSSFCVASRYRDLKTYRLAVELAREVRSHVLTWGKFDRWSLGLQLIDAIESVGANIAEAEGCFHAADRRRLLYIARGSLYEAEHWLARADDCRLTTPKWNERIG